MAQSEVLKSVAKDLEEIKPKILEAEELINAMREAGEDTAEMQSTLRTLKIRAEKWGKMLKGRGIV